MKSNIAPDHYGPCFARFLPGASRGWPQVVIVAAALIAASAAPAGANPTQDPLPFYPGSWTMVQIPDVQNYNNTDAKTLDFQAMTQWIVDNRASRNIQFVTSVGDLVNNNTAAQWTRAKAGFAKLNGHLPYAPVTGNHDYGSNGSANTRTTLFNNYFSPSDNPLNDPALGGALKGTYEPGKMENAYYTFSANQRDYLVLALEWGPRNGAVEWAKSVVENHPNHRVMLSTHAYLYYDNTRYDWGTKGSSQSWSPYAYGTANDPDGTNDGEQLWQKLVKRTPNMSMVINGHVLNDEIGYLASTGDHDNTVHQMLYNRQLEDDGQLRLLEFLPDGLTVQVKTYSPLTNQWRTDSAGQFTITLSPIPEPTGALLGAAGALVLLARRRDRSRPRI